MMATYPTVVHRAGAYWATCGRCEWWISPPQASRSDALDRAEAHRVLAHDRAELEHTYKKGVR